MVANLRSIAESVAPDSHEKDEKRELFASLLRTSAECGAHLRRSGEYGEAKSETLSVRTTFLDCIMRNDVCGDDVGVSMMRAEFQCNEKLHNMSNGK